MIIKGFGHNQSIMLFRWLFVVLAHWRFCMWPSIPPGNIDVLSTALRSVL